MRRQHLSKTARKLHAALTYHLVVLPLHAFREELDSSGPLWILNSHDCPVMSEAGVANSHMTGVRSYFDLAPCQDEHCHELHIISPVNTPDEALCK